MPILASAVLVLVVADARAQDGLTEIDRPASELEQVLAEQVELGEAAQEVRVVRVVVEPKTAAAWHTHPTPVYVYVAEGELVMEVEGREERTIGAGEAVAEPLDARMRVRNETDEPVKAVVFQISPSEKAFLEEEHHDN